MTTLSDDVRALFRRLHDEPRRIVFPFRLPSRNELDEAARLSPFEYNRLKRAHQNNVCAWALRYRFEPPEGRVIVACNWRERTRHRDPSNIVDGGRKILLDGIARGRQGPRGWSGAGLIHCDGWHCVAGFIDIITKSDDGEDSVEMVVTPIDLAAPLSKLARQAVVDLR